MKTDTHPKRDAGGSKSSTCRADVANQTAEVNRSDETPWLQIAEAAGALTAIAMHGSTDEDLEEAMGIVGRLADLFGAPLSVGRPPSEAQRSEAASEGDFRHFFEVSPEVSEMPITVENQTGRLLACDSFATVDSRGRLKAFRCAIREATPSDRERANVESLKRGAAELKGEVAQ